MSNAKNYMEKPTKRLYTNALKKLQRMETTIHTY